MAVPPCQIKCSTLGTSGEEPGHTHGNAGRTSPASPVDPSYPDFTHILVGRNSDFQMMMVSEDESWMSLTLEEAKRGTGLTSPNPPVGAVIVKEGRELARGWHQGAGLPHAERDALGKITASEARGATVYVTLEPCSTKGRTGACCDALMEAGVARVVYGARDPNRNHQGRADEILKKVGIEVISGILEKECRHLIRGFSMVQESGRPWVIAKTAISLDGRITRPPGEGQWLSGPMAREEVQLLRADSDAIITSGKTLRADNPALTLRHTGISAAKKQPWRVVVTERRIEQSEYRIFQDEHQDRTLLFPGRSKYEVLRTLASDYDVSTVLLEAGGFLLGAFQDEGLIDEWVIYLTPMVMGGPRVGLGGTGSQTLEDRLSLENVVIHRVGSDLCARGLVKRDGPFALER